MSATGKRVTLTVDGQACEGRAGESLIEALRRAGHEVPSLCHLAGLSPYGACRLCLVEIIKGGKRRLTTSCNYTVFEGLQVELDSKRVQRSRRAVIGLLLTRAPDSPRLRALAERYGVMAKPLSPRRDPDGCILCGLCVRVCRQGARAEALALSGRGEKKGLARRPYGEFPEACIGCGACAYVCPTDAIAMEAEAVKRLRDRWGAQRPCRYALLSLTPGAVCEHDYHCAGCEVDQRLVDLAGGRHPVFLLLEEDDR